MNSDSNARDEDSKPLTPSIFEIGALVVPLILISFRYVAIVAVVVVVLWNRKIPFTIARHLVVYGAIATFLLPFDIRFAGSTMHHGNSKSVFTLLPVFTAHQTAHSKIQKSHKEYYTSLIINRPHWVLSIDINRF